MGNFRVRTTFNKRLGQTAPSAWEFPKTEFLRLHPHSDLIVDKHTEQVRKLLMDSSWHALSYMLQVKTLCHTGKEGFGYLWLSKNFHAWVYTSPVYSTFGHTYIFPHGEFPGGFPVKEGKGRYSLPWHLLMDTGCNRASPSHFSPNYFSYH